MEGRPEEIIRDLQVEISRRDEVIADLLRQVDGLRSELNHRDIDELTGLHNLRWLREWWDVITRSGKPADVVSAVAFIDVDLLKRVNDTYGHTVGDRVITHVAAAIIASGCYGVRYGGDEFLLFVPAGRSVEMTLAGIVDAISSHPVPTRDGSISVTLSCGARMIGEEDRADLWRMIKDADVAMYQVKRARSGDVMIVS